MRPTGPFDPLLSPAFIETVENFVNEAFRPPQLMVVMAVPISAV
jgi:hypothetical protein